MPNEYNRMEEQKEELFDRQERFWGDIIYGILWLLGQLPSFIHYWFADLMSFLLRRVFRYRVEDVEQNIRHSYPDRDDAFVKDLTKKYYRHLGDLGVEYVMMAGFSRKRYLRHVRLDHSEVLRDLYAKGHSNVFLVLGHFGNWEWYTGFQTIMPETQFYILYQRQSRVWNYVFYRIRSKFGSRLLEKDEAPRQLISMRRNTDSKTFVFVADQVPWGNSVHLFLPFLNQNTATFTGMERLARALKAPVVYIAGYQPRRGYYTVDAQLLTKNASTMPENDLTVDFMKRLERDIIRQPQQWLWSHRRWKYTVDDIRRDNPNQEIVQR